MTDGDGDGLPTAFELQYGLDPSSSVDENGAIGDPDGDGITNAAERAADTHPRGTVVRHFAEGATGTFFDSTFTVVNPSPDSANVLFRFVRGEGSTTSHYVKVGANTRVTINAQTVPGLKAQSSRHWWKATNSWSSIAR